ncbi:hypothetical protein EHM76_00980 [bacterium]|nr:MAG: hypothetical protein EHM76_00980 [bacterium]
MFFDLNNFLNTSLNNAAQKMLNKKKLDIIDSSRLNNDSEYWKKNINDIIRYCIIDSQLTKELADYFWSMMKKTLNFLPFKPYSKGHFSEEYFMSKCYIPTIDTIPKEVLEYAYKSYYGGRFELIKKGYFPHVYCYDLKSAYPAEMVNLIDFTNGHWYEVKEYDKHAYTGFYFCHISCYHDLISPFMQKMEGLNVYPVGQFSQFLTQKDIEFALQHDKNIEIEIEKGYAFYPDELVYPLKEEIERLYLWKESEKNPDIKYCIKIVLNSLYGKFIQTVSGKTGKLFNPLYASLITANTRLKLMEIGFKYPDSIVSFSTDSVHSLIPLDLKQKRHDGLGDFALDFQGAGVYIQSDVYTLWNDEKRKNKFRGFCVISPEAEEIAVSDKKTLLDILQNLKGTKYEYSKTRPLHLGECLRHSKVHTVEDINIFTEIKKEVDINGDSKRNWSREFKNGIDVLQNQIDSRPIMLMETDKDD